MTDGWMDSGCASAHVRTVCVFVSLPAAAAAAAATAAATAATAAAGRGTNTGDKLEGFRACMVRHVREMVTTLLNLLSVVVTVVVTEVGG